MSYQSTTPNLGLPQWVLSDGPQMSDFNGAFQDIDNFAGEKGAANGIATLDASGKVVQNPASAGVANGIATLDADGRLTAAQTAITNGSNANGSYTLFPDGTLVCRMTVDVTVPAGSGGGASVTFPYPFIDDNLQAVTSAKADSNTNFYATGLYPYNGTRGTVHARNIFSTEAVTIPVMAVVIGKWK